MESECCSGCIFWCSLAWGAGHEPDSGLCRFNPPPIDGWSKTRASEWCGKFKEGLVNQPEQGRMKG